MTEQDLHDYNEWLTEVWSKQISIPFHQDAPNAYLEYRKKQLRIGGFGSITELELKNILIDFGGIVKKSLNKEVVDIAESFVVYNRIKD